MIYKIIKWIGVISIIGIFIYFCFWIYAIMSFAGAFDKHYTKDDLIENYESKRTQIQAVKSYFDEIVPTNTTVDIEFAENGYLEIFHISGVAYNSNNWNLLSDSKTVDSLLQKLNWSKENLTILKQKLDKANCISVKNGAPCQIGFQRSGMGKYFYNLYTKSINDSLKDSIEEICSYRYYNRNLVFEYGGGAIGSDCFPGREN